MTKLWHWQMKAYLSDKIGGDFVDNYQNVFRLDGKNALIVGGSGGLGGAIAEGFLQSGANVVVAGRHPEKVSDSLETVAKSLKVDYFGIQVDITNQSSVEKMAESLEKRYNRIDILVNSAGINILKKAEEYDEVSFDKVMDVNVKGTHLVTKAIGKMMISNHYGRIINISSAKGTIGTKQDYIAYCASKGAINMYTKQLACEWAKYDITCNAIAPTFVRTNINAFQLDNEEFYNKLIDRIPLGRIGAGKDIANAAIFLASEASSFITGQILGVDGGLTAMQ
jgi:NAD(P)-dependent dehydrogenase (short-subunit alcohol dehydrogenase family)